MSKSISAEFGIAQVRMESMSLANENHTIPDHLVPAAFKGFLESFQFTRLGLPAGRQIVRIGQKLGDPVQRKHWISRFCLPLRNALLLNRPLRVSFNGIPVFLVPQGAVAGDIWAGLRCGRHEVSFLLSVLE